MNKKMKAYYSLKSQNLNLRKKNSELRTDVRIKEDNAKYWSQRYLEEDLYTRKLNYQIDELRHCEKILQNKIDLKNSQNEALRLKVAKLNKENEELKTKLAADNQSKSIFARIFAR